MGGAALILSERLRVLHHEQYSKEHDKLHNDQELLDAALAYIFIVLGNDSGADSLWPFEDDGFKPVDDPIRNLVIAGQFIAAEIDRLQDEKV